jgi:hypothetical protein
MQRGMYTYLQYGNFANNLYESGIFVGHLVCVAKLTNSKDERRSETFELAVQQSSRLSRRR